MATIYDFPLKQWNVSYAGERNDTQTGQCHTEYSTLPVCAPDISSAIDIAESSLYLAGYDRVDITACTQQYSFGESAIRTMMREIDIANGVRLHLLPSSVGDD